ncbi:MAG: hypothetical protein IJU76_03530 [Desulfovibrionaceae bacterium]|nr:hypothetical protein [Desulfovibrionaceae bacterium]
MVIIAAARGKRAVSRNGTFFVAGRHQAELVHVGVRRHNNPTLRFPAGSFSIRFLLATAWPNVLKPLYQFGISRIKAYMDFNA